MRVNRFVRQQDGATGVEFVVVAALVVGLGVAVMATVGAGSADLGDDVGDELSRRNITLAEGGNDGQNNSGGSGSADGNLPEEAPANEDEATGSGDGAVGDVAGGDAGAGNSESGAAGTGDAAADTGGAGDSGASDAGTSDAGASDGSPDNSTSGGTGTSDSSGSSGGVIETPDECLLPNGKPKKNC